MPDLAVRDLTKTFGRSVRAVDGMSFDVADREFVFILGPSGAGKTTTLRAIAGLEQPDAGSVSLAGRNITHVSPRERNVAMVYDKNSLYPHLSVFENMAYPLRLKKQSDSEMRRQIGRVADILQIGQLLERRPSELSGGQQQRVAIGRMLVRQADLYLMDEPISHLDAKLRAHMRLEFKKLQKEFAATILYVSHDQLEAMTMGDRVVVVDHGRVQQIGTPREIFDRPANQFVATFVGEPSMNVMDCELRQDGDRHTLSGEGFAALVATDWINASPALGQGGRTLRMGIRPQHIEIVPSQYEGQPNVERGTIYAVETLGSETIFDVAMGGSIIRAWVRNSDLRSVSRRIGDPVFCRFDPDRIYLFDADDGRTLAQARSWGPAEKAA